MLKPERPPSVASFSSTTPSFATTAHHPEGEDVPGKELTPEELEQMKKTFAQVDVATSQTAPEEGKLKAILGFLKNSIGVKDISSLRISLPANVCDPVSLLEYMVIMEHPETFVAIAQHPTDPEARMLAVVKWFLSTNRLHLGKIMKAYNPILGEVYSCTWQTPTSSSLRPPSRSSQSSSTHTTLTNEYQIVYTAEQISHHPPKTAFSYACPTLGLKVTGICQIAAKFTGTAVKLKHLYGMTLKVTVDDKEEEYRITFPRGILKGLLVMNPYVQLEGIATVTCRDTGLRTVIDFKEEKWYSLQRTFFINGFMSRYDPKLVDVPPKKMTDLYPGEQIIAQIAGNWRGQVTITQGKTKSLLLDMETMLPTPRTVRPMEEQTDLESRIVWKDVNRGLETGDFSSASKAKNSLEDAQRKKAKDRQGPWHPRYYKVEARERWPETGPIHYESFNTDDYPTGNDKYWVEMVCSTVGLPTREEEEVAGEIAESMNELGIAE